jgi:hypothetical protein
MKVQMRVHTTSRHTYCPDDRNGAYHIQHGDGGGVPRADVRVEGRRLGERLQAEPHEVRTPPDAVNVGVSFSGRLFRIHVDMFKSIDVKI